MRSHYFPSRAMCQVLSSIFYLRLSTLLSFLLLLKLPMLTEKQVLLNQQLPT